MICYEIKDDKIQARLEAAEATINKLPQYQQQSMARLLERHAKTWWAYTHDGVWPETASGRNAVVLLGQYINTEVN